MTLLYGMLAFAFSVGTLTTYALLVAAKRADESADRMIVPLRSDRYRVISCRATRN